MGEIETVFDLLARRLELAPMLLLLVGCATLWLSWRAERKERNAIQEARITDFRVSLDANTKASLEQAAAMRALADKLELARQSIDRGRTR